MVLWLQLPEGPTSAPVFMEDLPEDEQDVTGFAKYGAGEPLLYPGLSASPRCTAIAEL